MNGHIDVVDYLCSECDVNVNKTGIFRLQTSSTSLDSTLHHVASLWVACVKAHIDIVKLLHEKYNADINTRSDSNSTALRSACYMSNNEICKYLVENKACIEEANLMGGTPLINSIQSVYLVNLLIENGVNVNYQDNTGTTALHFAIQEYQNAAKGTGEHFFDVIKVLVQSGANPRLKNIYNEDSYRLASMKWDQPMLIYLVKNTNPSIDVIVDNLRLIGTYYADYLEVMHRAVKMWQRAIRLCTLSTTAVSPFDFDEFTVDDDEFYRDVNDKYVAGLSVNCEENANDEVLIRYSCLIKSQLLGKFKTLKKTFFVLSNLFLIGKYHRETLFTIMKRGAFYANDHMFKLSVEYWNYALLLTLNYKYDERQQNIKRKISNSIVNNELDYYRTESIFIVNSLTSLYHEIYCKFKNKTDENNNSQIITCKHLILLYNAIESQIKELLVYVHDTPINYLTCRNFNQLLQTFLNCVNFILNFDFRENLAERQLLLDKIRKFLRKNSLNLYSKYKLSSSLIHLCASKTTTNHSLMISQTNLFKKFDVLAKYGFPNLSLIKFLLNINCGYNLNMKNDMNETPLFLLIKQFKKNIDFYSLLNIDERKKSKFINFEFTLAHEIINYMCNNGAHIDIYDSESNLLSNLFMENEFYIDQMKHVKLSCLCANVIKKFNVKYNSKDLPVELCSFIEIH